MMHVTETCRDGFFDRFRLPEDGPDVELFVEDAINGFDVNSIARDFALGNINKEVALEIFAETIGCIKQNVDEHIEDFYQRRAA